VGCDPSGQAFEAARTVANCCHATKPTMIYPRSEVLSDPVPDIPTDLCALNSAIDTCRLAAAEYLTLGLYAEAMVAFQSAAEICRFIVADSGPARYPKTIQSAHRHSNSWNSAIIVYGQRNIVRNEE
jgi:hypothetical protein